MASIGFDGRVAVVTGAGGGLGREHALLLASRGCRVVVNDIGGSLDGTPAGTLDGASEGAVVGTSGSASRADTVVAEIEAAGGEAVADRNSVTTPEGGAAIVQTAIDTYGRIDIVVNNAGILRDKSFPAMTADLVDPVIDVHLKGAFNVTRAAWGHFKAQGFGRVVSTSSAAGLFGNFGQANYGAAKMGLVGLTTVLTQEGRKYNIKANVIAPLARTRMTDQVLGKLADLVDPRLISPVVVFLCHDDCPVSGHIYSVGGGRVARVFIGLTTGWGRADGELTVEDVVAHLAEIEDTSEFTIPESIADDHRALRDAVRGR